MLTLQTIKPILHNALGITLCLGFSLITQAQNKDNNDAASKPVDNVPYELIRLDWTEQLTPGATLVLDNRWGDIRLRQIDGSGAANLHAVMQKIGRSPKVATLKANREGDRVTLLIAYPDDQRPASHQEGRVDAALLVPYGIQVEVIAEHGSVSSKSMDSPIKVTAVDQPVSLKTASSINITTNKGEVNVQFISRKETDKQLNRGHIQTIFGDINVRYYPKMPISFDMLSGHPKTTNDLNLLSSRKIHERRIYMETGHNPENLSLQSDTGYIRLINIGSEI